MPSEAAASAGAAEAVGAGVAAGAVKPAEGRVRSSQTATGLVLQPYNQAPPVPALLTPKQVPLPHVIQRSTHSVVVLYM